MESNLDNKLKEMLKNTTEVELNRKGRSLESEHNFIIESVPGGVGNFTKSAIYICTKCSDVGFRGDNLPKVGCFIDEEEETDE